MLKVTCYAPLPTARCRCTRFRCTGCSQARCREACCREAGFCRFYRGADARPLAFRRFGKARCCGQPDGHKKAGPRPLPCPASGRFPPCPVHHSPVLYPPALQRVGYGLGAKIHGQLVGTIFPQLA